MIRALSLVFLAVLLSGYHASGQKRYNTWFFGIKSGLDFNSDPPAPLKNPNINNSTPPYYTSTICDQDGRMMFYTDGIKIWDSRNKEFTVYNKRWPWLESSDIVLPLICPYPGNDSLYYLFGISKGNGWNQDKLLVLTIKMKPGSTSGSIVYPDSVTATNYFSVLAEKGSFMLAGIGHCNQRDVWILNISGNAINSYLVTSQGINSVPVVSNLAVSQNMLTSGYSTMKFSANGEKLVIPDVSEKKIIIYNFNNQTGACSNPVIINVPENEFLEDIELSPDGRKLYYGSFEYGEDGPGGIELHNIFQLNLEAGTGTEIERSRIKLNDYPDRGGCPRSCYIINRTLQLGPDGKIYISQRILSSAPLDTKLNVIEFPNQTGVDAYYRLDYLDLKQVYGFVNVNYIRSGSFSLKENGIQVRKKICLGLPTDFSLLYTKIDSVKWDFGDPPSGSENFSNKLAPSHNYHSTGKYTVRAIIYKNCWTDTAVSTVSIDPDPIVRIPDYIKDTVTCRGATITMDATTEAANKYLWSDGLIYPYRDITKSGSFLVRAFNDCSNDQRSFTVTFEDCPCDVFVPNAFTPNKDGLNDTFKPIVQCAAGNYYFRVLNRYGNVLFSSREIGKGWDGTYKSNQLSTGVYAWMVQYRNPNTKQFVTKKGTVALIR